VEPEADFMRKPVWQRLLIMVAGPAFNVGLVFLLFTVALIAGQPQLAPVLGEVWAGTPAAELGLRRGDRVDAIDGVEIEVFSNLADGLARVDVPHTLTVRRGEATFERSIPAGTLTRDDGGYVDLDAFGVWMGSLSSAVGVDDPLSPAGRAGLRTGDVVRAVDGVAVANWHELVEALSTGDRHALTVERRPIASEAGVRVAATPAPPPTSGERLRRTLACLWQCPSDVEQLDVEIAASDWRPRDGDVWTGRFGLTPAMMFVRSVQVDSAGDVAGIRPGDRVVSVDGVVIDSWTDITVLVRATSEAYHADAEPRALELVVVRDGSIVPLRFSPKMYYDEEREVPAWRPLIGIGPYGPVSAVPETVRKYYGPVEAFTEASREVGDLFRRILRTLQQLITWERGLSTSVGGPVRMVSLAGEAVDLGIFPFLRLIGAISLSLGVVNLLPVPALDGGQILFYSVEAVRGRPLSLAVRERMMMIGVLLLVSLMIVVTVLDISAVLR
jgi:regulator of sigma E protease